MVELIADQLIYSRVEKEYSSDYSSGYKIVYSSGQLSDSEKEEIQKNIRCYNAVNSSSKRYQFFTISSEKAVITQTIRLEPGHPDYNIYIDKARRPGVALVHALILDIEEFSQAQFNPFVIIDNVQFISSLEEFIDLIQEQKGQHQIPLIRIPIKNYLAPELSWETSQLQKLYKLAYFAEKITDRDQTILLIGNQETINSTISLLTCLLRVPKRLKLSFNTSADGCTYKPGVFWSIGTESYSPNKTHFAVINVDSQTFEKFPERLQTPTDPYSRWLLVSLETMKDRELFEKLSIVSDIVFALEARLLLDDSWWQINSENQFELLEEFKSINSRLIQRLLFSEIQSRGQFDVLAIESLTAYIFRTKKASRILAYITRSSISAHYLEQDAIDWFTSLELSQMQELLGVQSWNYLKDISNDTEYKKFVTFWSEVTFGDPQSSYLGRLSGDLTNYQYEHLLEYINDPIKPAWLVPQDESSNVKILVNHTHLENISFDDFFELSQALLSSQNWKYIEYLTSLPILTKLNYRQLRKIRRLLNNYQNHLPAFEKRIDSLLDNDELKPKLVERVVSTVMDNVDNLWNKGVPLNSEDTTKEVSQQSNSNFEDSNAESYDDTDELNYNLPYVSTDSNLYEKDDASVDYVSPDFQKDSLHDGFGNPLQEVDSIDPKEYEEDIREEVQYSSNFPMQRDPIDEVLENQKYPDEDLIGDQPHDVKAIKTEGRGLENDLIGHDFLKDKNSEDDAASKGQVKSDEVDEQDFL